MSKDTRESMISSGWKVFRTGEARNTHNRELSPCVKCPVVLDLSTPMPNKVIARTDCLHQETRCVAISKCHLKHIYYILLSFLIKGVNSLSKNIGLVRGEKRKKHLQGASQLQAVDGIARKNHDLSQDSTPHSTHDSYFTIDSKVTNVSAAQFIFQTGNALNIIVRPRQRCSLCQLDCTTTIHALIAVRVQELFSRYHQGFSIFNVNQSLWLK
mmetsp:Transcript_19638/g.35645  ORF Transcript_19638/g.35645 Transcript_19638/m.35645 type:complete len:213 (-) Transcript_19638:733-1371(-)